MAGELKLYKRVCKCGCGLGFRTLKTSKQVYAAASHDPTLTLHFTSGDFMKVQRWLNEECGPRPEEEPEDVDVKYEL